jgi:hypothetical protein
MTLLHAILFFPLQREHLEAKERQLQGLIDTWSREEQNWDLLLATHTQQQDKFVKLIEKTINNNNNNKSKNSKNNIGKTDTTKKSDEVLAKARQYVVELGTYFHTYDYNKLICYAEKVKPHLSDLENYISLVQNKLTTVASDIQYSAISANNSSAQELIRTCTLISFAKINMK